MLPLSFLDAVMDPSSSSLLFGADVQDAVSVQLGGVVARSQLAHLGDSSGRLILEDPLTGASAAASIVILIIASLSLVRVPSKRGKHTQTHTEQRGEKPLPNHTRLFFKPTDRKDCKPST
jgi:hypothetical protein